MLARKEGPPRGPKHLSAEEQRQFQQAKNFEKMVEGWIDRAFSDEEPKEINFENLLTEKEHQHAKKQSK